MTTIATEALEQAGMSQADLDDARADVVRASYALVDRFIEADALSGVYKAFGETPYDGTDRRGKFTHAKAFSNAHLDYREGKPRTRTPRQLEPARHSAVVRLGEETGMIGESSAEGTAVDIALIQGSYKEGIYHRTELARRHVATQKRQQPERPMMMLLGMGIERPLTEEDYRSRIEYAEDAATEYDLVNAAIELQFATQSPGDWPIHTDENGMPYDVPGKVRSYHIPGITRARSLSAPKVEGRAFANTADTHRLAVRFMGGTHKILGKTVLGTTAQVYEPFQRADMLRIWGLPYGAQVEMAGYHDPAWTQPAHIANETNALFNQGARLLDEIDALHARRPESKTTIDLGSRS